VTNRLLFPEVSFSSSKPGGFLVIMWLVYGEGKQTAAAAGYQGAILLVAPPSYWLQGVSICYSAATSERS
jgi:hypothetical protein